MSRIGDKPINLPPNVTASVAQGMISIKGPKGELSQDIPQGIDIKIDQDIISVARKRNARQIKAYHGLIRSLIDNMIKGVVDGYVKKLELVGTGYRAKKQGSKIVLSVGFSHPVEIQPPSDINLDLEGETIIIVSGIDKQKVGHMAAVIRDVRKPEPYKGKGIRYQGEIVRRKAGKAAKVGSAT